MGMSSTKYRIPLWEKTAFHYSLCFTIGFFTGFTPSNIPSSSSSFVHIVSYNEQTLPKLNPPVETPPLIPNPPNKDSDPGLETRRLLIAITTTGSGDPLLPALVERLGRTLRLVAPPLIWVVVESRPGDPAIAGVLRRSGVLYRHLTFRENFTDPEAEAHHQRNVALAHLEHHRIDGIVHFAGVSNVYHLRFFEEIREIEVFGAWPVAIVSAASREPEVFVDDPACNSSQVVGQNPKDSVVDDGITKERRPISLWGFGFNSSVLWDPERWGRPTSLPDTSQDSMGFLQQVITEGETKVSSIPSDCSLLLWRFLAPIQISGRRTRPASFRQLQPHVL